MRLKEVLLSFVTLLCKKEREIEEKLSKFYEQEELLKKYYNLNDSIGKIINIMLKSRLEINDSLTWCLFKCIAILIIEQTNIISSLSCLEPDCSLEHGFVTMKQTVSLPQGAINFLLEPPETIEFSALFVITIPEFPPPQAPAFMATRFPIIVDGELVLIFKLFDHIVFLSTNDVTLEQGKTYCQIITNCEYTPQLLVGASAPSLLPASNEFIPIPSGLVFSSPFFQFESIEIEIDIDNNTYISTGDLIIPDGPAIIC